MTKYMINEQYDVEDADASKGFGKGEKREDYADAWKDTGNAVLIGLPGCGRKVLARLLAERTGMDVAVPGDARAATKALDAKGSIIVLADALVEDASVQPLIHGAGKVFYLMADSKVLSGRVAEGADSPDIESLWRETSARLAVMEPIFYSVLHFIMQAAQAPEDMLEDALEKIGY